MPKSVIAKNRFHRGTSAALRSLLRRAGVSFDEEQAQFALGGSMPFLGVGMEVVEQARDEVLSDRHEHNRQWEQQHPGRNPYPPSFPDRVLRLARQALEESLDEDNHPMNTLQRLVAIAEAETRSEVFGPPDDMQIG